MGRRDSRSRSTSRRRVAGGTVRPTVCAALPRGDALPPRSWWEGLTRPQLRAAVDRDDAAGRDHVYAMSHSTLGRSRTHVPTCDSFSATPGSILDRRTNPPRVLGWRWFAAHDDRAIGVLDDVDETPRAGADEN
jgi:hypothetical protein